MRKPPAPKHVYVVATRNPGWKAHPDAVALLLQAFGYPNTAPAVPAKRPMMEDDDDDKEGVGNE